MARSYRTEVSVESFLYLLPSTPVGTVLDLPAVQEVGVTRTSEPTMCGSVGVLTFDNDAIGLR